MSSGDPSRGSTSGSSVEEDGQEMEDAILFDQGLEDSGTEEDVFIKKKEEKVFIPRRIVANSREESKKGYSPKPVSNKVSTTKYSIFTFLPKNLFEQFRRLANFYFLFVALITLTPWTPSSPWANWVPLILVLSVTAIKEAIEDIYRWKSDNEINRSKCEVFVEDESKYSKLKMIQWKRVKIGDIVRVNNREFFPCDLVMLSSSEEEGMAYVETSNLDGETNLKIKQAVKETAIYTTEKSISNFRGRIDCEHPNPRLYQFDGTLNLPEEHETARERFHDEILRDEEYKRSIPLGEKQILLRGSQLRNTKWCYGLAIFTGKQTKLMMNATKTKAKRSKVEKKTNLYLLAIFAIHFGLCAICAIAGSIFQAWLHGDDPYLLLTDEDQILDLSIPFTDIAWSPGGSINLARFLPYLMLTRFLTYVALYSIMIPISLYVTMELVKIAIVFSINNDIDMYYEPTDTPALARTSNIHEELGQIDYIFSDKTGTLTCNIMEFAKCCVGSKMYGNDKDLTLFSEIEDFPVETGSHFRDKEIMFDLLHGEEKDRKLIDEFLKLLSVCHTVIPEADTDDPTKLIYQAASPDEAALVTGAKCMGYYFHARTPSDVTVRVLGKDQKFEILNVLEFNSTRKRMSVIVKDKQTNAIKLYTKGADTMIMERLDESNLQNRESRVDLDRNLEMFATEGLRTLVLAMREIPAEEYREWHAGYHKACCSLVNREEEIDASCELMEKNLILIGATAIEDKLQEGVPETISKLSDAGIKIWVLTGDKQETAINIGFSCKLLYNEMERMIVSESTAEATEAKLTELLETYPDNKDVDYGLIIDGGTLLFALDEKVKGKLLTLAKRCKAVICCRVSPKQKMEIVNLIRNNLKCTSLAIGDGANDVPMIQAAHIGIGISGQEGLQAVRASDYAIAQFRFLQNLLLIHGNWSYRRVSLLIIYSFYKNMYFALVKVWFNVVNGFSGQLMVDSFLSTFYNIIFTSAPIIVFGIYEKTNTEAALLKYPQLYANGLKNRSFNLPRFLMWIVIGILQATVTFWIPALTLYQPIHNGNFYGITELGVLVYGIIIIVANAKLALQMKSWTIVSLVFIVGSVAAYFVILFVYNLPRLSMFRVVVSMEFAWFNLLISPQYWLLTVLVVLICILPEVAVSFVWEWFFPRDEVIVRQMRKKGKFIRPWKRRDYRYIPGSIKHRGFAFSAEGVIGKLPKRFFRKETNEESGTTTEIVIS